MANLFRMPQVGEFHKIVFPFECLEDPLNHSLESLPQCKTNLLHSLFAKKQQSCPKHECSFGQVPFSARSTCDTRPDQPALRIAAHWKQYCLPIALKLSLVNERVDHFALHCIALRVVHRPAIRAAIYWNANEVRGCTAVAVVHCGRELRFVLAKTYSSLLVSESAYRNRQFVSLIHGQKTWYGY